MDEVSMLVTDRALTCIKLYAVHESVVRPLDPVKHSRFTF